jgi:hypothetical protein
VGVVVGVALGVGVGDPVELSLAVDVLLAVEVSLGEGDSLDVDVVLVSGTPSGTSPSYVATTMVDSNVELPAPGCPDSMVPAPYGMVTVSVDPSLASSVVTVNRMKV